MAPTGSMQAPKQAPAGKAARSLAADGRVYFRYRPQRPLPNLSGPHERECVCIPLMIAFVH